MGGICNVIQTSWPQYPLAAEKRPVSHWKNWRTEPVWTPSHIGKIERGCWNPNLQTLARIATGSRYFPSRPVQLRHAGRAGLRPSDRFRLFHHPLLRISQRIRSSLFRGIFRQLSHGAHHRGGNRLDCRTLSGGGSRMRLFPRPSHLRTAPTADMGSPPSIRENGTRSGFP